jgi:hypothetical protein
MTRRAKTRIGGGAASWRATDDERAAGPAHAPAISRLPTQPPL